jgi:SOS-response transcriptional repressor LexA
MVQPHRVWDTTYMATDERSPLQVVLADAIARAPHTRDYYDNQLRGILDTTGKPLWDVERGKVKNPGPRTLRAMEEVLGFQPEQLVDLVHPPRGRAPVSPDRSPTVSAAGDDTVEIIALDLSLSMGPGTLIEEFAEAEPIRMSVGFVQAITRTPSDRLRLVKGIGDSMEPTLRAGDRVMIDINEKQLSRSHGVYWIDHLGTHGIKRLRAAGRGKILVMSDNPNVPDFEVDAEDLRIEGRVIWFARDL